MGIPLWSERGQGTILEPYSCRGNNVALPSSDGDLTAFRGVVRSRPRVVRSWSDPGVGGPIRDPDLPL